MAVFMYALKIGDTVLGMDLSNGGHLSHGSPVNFSGINYNIVSYGVDENGVINYDEVDFYIYLDEPHKKIYNENKEEMAEVVSYDDKEIKFVNKYHTNRRTYTENYTLDRYTGRAKGEGTIRHDYGKWASLTYENRDFYAKGQCAVVGEMKKF